jgi:hypothetical protein
VRYLSNSSRAMALELWAQEERHQVQMAAMRRQMQRALQAASRCLGQNAAASGSSLSRAAGAANAKLRDRADLSRQRSKELSSQFNAALARAGLREADNAAEQDGGDSSDSDSGGVVLADLDPLLKSKAPPHGSDKMARESRASSSVDERAEQPDGSAHSSAWGSEPPSPMPPAAGQGSASQAQGLAQGGSSGGPESGRPAAQAPTSARGAGEEGAAVPAAGAAAPASSGGFFSSFFGRGGGSDLQNV